MRQSHLFTKTRREAPKDETAKNAELLIRAGFIHKDMAGVYSYLPLGMRVIEKIKAIVSEEMQMLGSNEILMSSLQPKEVWEKTNRWSDEKVDVWFKSELKNGNQIGFGWSHEEPIGDMMKYHIASYHDLPRYVHQFQTKFRNEVRAKSGIMRGREFLMKDMYSFCATEDAHMKFYTATIDAYLSVYRRVGLGEITYVTSASGGLFTDKFSHEFQTICDAGEDEVYVDKIRNIAVNSEVFNAETLEKVGGSESDFEKVKTAEVGNIFTFGTGKSEELGLYFTDADGTQQPVYLGSYGIGVSRLMGVVAEVFSDDKGLVWPQSIAPFTVHIVPIFGQDAEKKDAIQARVDEVVKKLTDANIDVLVDDRDARPGEKFTDADLIGIPHRFVISEKVPEGMVEYKARTAGDVSLIQVADMFSYISETDIV
jgi:prolyl-tRNA synthetase